MHADFAGRLLLPLAAPVLGGGRDFSRVYTDAMLVVVIVGGAVGVAIVVAHDTVANSVVVIIVIVIIHAAFHVDAEMIAVFIVNLLD